MSPAAAASGPPLLPTTTPPLTPTTLSLPLPHSPPGSNQHIHLHISLLGLPLSSSPSPAKPAPKTLLVFASTASSASSAQASVTHPSGGLHPGSSPMGSLVYALPSRTNKSEVFATPLYAQESSVEFATRLAKLLVRRNEGWAVYVGYGGGLGIGVQVEDEVEVLKGCLAAITGVVKQAETSVSQESRTA